MRYAPLLFLFGLLPGALKAQCLQVLTSGTPSNLYAVGFWDPSTGLAAGDSGVIRRTTDSGQTWSGMPSNTQKSLYALFTLNDGSFKAWAVGAGGVIRCSGDGGQSWEQQYAPVRADLHAVAFRNSTDGIAVGACGTLLRTLDGGATWLPLASGTDQTLRALVFQGANAVAAGDNGAVCFSTDGGATWTATTVGHQPWYAAAGNRWLAGAAPNLQVSADGGQSWAPRASGGADWYGLDFHGSGQKGLLAGLGGRIFFSNTGGQQWEDRSDPSITNALYDIAFLTSDSSTAYACGAEGTLLRIRLPSASAATPRDTLCAGSDLQLLADGGAFYAWNGPAGFLSLEQNPLRVQADPSMGGTYVVEAGVFPGCTDTASVTVAVLPSPVADLPLNRTACAGDSVAPVVFTGGLPGSNFRWTNTNPAIGLAASGAGNLPAFTAVNNGTAPDTAWITLTPFLILGADTCAGTPQSFLVIALPKPVATAGAVNVAVCEGEAIELTGAGGVVYDWSGPDGFVAANTQNPVRSDATAAMTGTYTLTVADSFGCTGVDSVAIIVRPTPIAQAGAVRAGVCAGQSIELTGSGGLLYNWSGPAGFALNENPNPVLPNADPMMAGWYELTVTDAWGCTDVDSVVVDVFPNPEATATGGVVSCIRPVLDLQGESSLANPSYTWTGPGGFTSTLQNPPVTEAGIYTLVVDVNGCTGSDTALVTVSSPVSVSVATPGGALLTCANPTLTLLAQPQPPGGNYEYLWSNNLGTSQLVVVDSPGTYTVTITDPTSGCTNVSAPLAIGGNNTPPVATAVGGSLPCGVGSVALVGSADVPGATFSWTGPGGFFSTEQNPAVSQTGVYTLTVTTAGDCTGTAAATVVSVGTPPQPVINGPVDFCGDPLLLDAGAGFQAYLWSTGDTTPSIDVNSVGTFTVTVTNSDNCTATATHQVSAGAPPTPVVSGPTGTCGGTVTLDAGPGYQTYRWSTGATTQTIAVNGTGIYGVTVSNGPDCVGATAHVIDDASAPAVAITGPGIACNGLVTLGAGAGFVQYQWSNGQSGASVDVGPGSYTVTVTNEKGCTATDTATVASGTGLFSAFQDTICRGESLLFGGRLLGESGVYRDTLPGGGGCDSIVQLRLTVLPSLTLTTDTTICRGSSLALSASGCADCDFEWGGNAGFDPVLTVSPDTSTTYTVTATHPIGCSVALSVNVYVREPQDTLIPAYICQGETFVFNGKNYNTTGVYKSLIVNGNCVDTATIELTVLEELPFMPQADTLILTPGETEDRLNVSDNDRVPPGLLYAVEFISPSTTGSLITISNGSVTYRPNSQTASIAEVVNYRICDLECSLGCADGVLYIFNLDYISAFSPNGDGVNDVWDPLAVFKEQGPALSPDQASMSIVNRWGELIYHADPYAPWDGRVNGATVPAGTYYYILQINTQDGQVDKKPVTVIR